MSIVKPLQSNRGSMLVYILVATVVISILALSFTSRISGFQKEIASSRKLATKQFDINRLLKLLQLPNGLTESSGLIGNENLFVCLKGGLLPGCTENCCQSGVVKSFSFIDPSDNNLSVNSKGKLVGTAAQPVYYNNDGSKCLERDPLNCSYYLYSSYTAQCPGGDPTCHHAEHLNVTVHLKAQAVSTQIKSQDVDYKFVYFNDVNYTPEVRPIPSLTMYLDEPAEVEMDISGYSGHPSEVQNFIFNLCESADPAIVQITTPPNQTFLGGVAKIKLKAMALGTTTINLQINDGGVENNLSKVLPVNVTVLPGVKPI